MGDNLSDFQNRGKKVEKFGQTSKPNAGLAI
jgi:hypothetical protein